ncbi:hypothetical protein BDV93DRAFT_519568 [Ceratobasidium sp. AG-I]|nr:hypothetical protein BDV93DRAFT_519568 [Ceratobasidium sp. AG-I]
MPASLREGAFQSANSEQEVPKPVSVSAVASMFEAKAKETMPPNRTNSASSSRPASGLSRTAPPRPPPKPSSLTSRPST